MRARDGEWVLFRTVLHIREVYGKNHGIDDYLDEIVAIGARMTTIIEEKAGYVRPDHEKLVTMFGQYLAHYAVLKRVHSAARANGKSASGIDMAVDESAVFPRDIDMLVEQDFQAINRDLAAWRTRAEQANEATSG